MTEKQQGHRVEEGAVMVELPWVYDGISIVEHTDGTVENVWETQVKMYPKERIYQWRAEETAKYIERNYRDGKFRGPAPSL